MKEKLLKKKENNDNNKEQEEGYNKRNRRHHNYYVVDEKKNIPKEKGKIDDEAIHFDIGNGGFGLEPDGPGCEE